MFGAEESGVITEDDFVEGLLFVYAVHKYLSGVCVVL